jgi:hypothetical protein
VATTWEILDEITHQVIILDWDDLDTLPDLDGGLPAGARARPMRASDGHIDFLTELRKLNLAFAAA